MAIRAERMAGYGGGDSRVLLIQAAAEDHTSGLY
jgi:hypothetical protein